MGTIPAVPVFPAGYAAQGAQLAELAAAITWCMSGKPLTELEQRSAQTFTTGTAAAVTWDTKLADRDSGWSSGSSTRYTAQTPGYYLAAAGVSFSASSAGVRIAYFQVTTGSGNPGGAGNTTQFGDKATTASSTTLTRLSLGMLTPYLYVGDYVEVYAEQTSGGNLATSSCYWELTLVSLGP